jgi:hypothetical protein
LTTPTKSVFRVSSDGKVNIGAQNQNQNPTHNGAFLTVNGKVVSKEVIVTQQSWADYVFAKNYKLLTLENLEKYIKENNHLPNIPSAKEVENNGVNLGEISKAQMEKIEELTLYIKELKKELEAIKKEVRNK